MVKKFPEKFKLGDNQQLVLDFEALLKRYGYEVPGNSPLEKAMLGAVEMFETHKDKSVHDLNTDCRDRWRQTFSLIEIARKMLAAEHHPDFGELAPHFDLLTGLGEISQFSMIPLTAIPTEKDANNKIFELLVAGILFQLLSNIHLEKPKPAKRDKRNPDVMGEFKGKRWGFACKTSHSTNPQTFLARVREGIEQIEAADVERGIVIVNLKNLVPHDEIWPAFQDPQSGHWIYVSFRDRHGAAKEIRRIFGEFENQVYALVGGFDASMGGQRGFEAFSKNREVFIAEFAGKKAVPLVLMLYCTVAGYSPKLNVVGPTITKLLAEAGVPTERMDAESNMLVERFNDHLHDRAS